MSAEPAPAGAHVCTIQLCASESRYFCAPAALQRRGGGCVDTGVAKGSGQNEWLWVTFLRATLHQSCECSEAGVML